jgi:AcrR family transcriptional regulator
MSARILVVSDDVKARRGYRSPLRAEQANETRRRVLSAARELLLARGYAGTTVAAVADHAGVSPDTIYVALGGKQGLLEGAWSLALSEVQDPPRLDDDPRRDDPEALADPRERLRGLVRLSCQTLARTSPVHAVIRGAADGHPFAADLRARVLAVRLRIQSDNLRAHLVSALRKGLTLEEAAARYSALLSPELYTLLTVECGWSARQYESWVADSLDRDLLG